MSASITRHCAGSKGESIQPNHQNSCLQIYTLWGEGHYPSEHKNNTAFRKRTDAVTDGNRTL